MLLSLLSVHAMILKLKLLQSELEHCLQKMEITLQRNLKAKLEASKGPLSV